MNVTAARIALAFFLFATPLFATNTFVQQNATTSSLTGATVSLAYTSNVTNGDLLVTALRWGIPTSNITSVTGTSSCNVTWTVSPRVLIGSSSVGSSYAYAFAASTGACTVTWTLAASDPGEVMVIGEWSGQSSVKIASTPIVYTNQTTISSTAIGVANGDLLIGIFQMQNGSATVTPNSGFTLRSSGTSSGTTYAALTDNLNATAGPSQTAGITVGAGQDGSSASIVCLGTCTFASLPTHHSQIVRYQRDRKISWDDRKRRLDKI